MEYEGIRFTKEIGSTRELNKYLDSGWVLILSYVKHLSDTQQPRFVIGWKSDNEPVYPELLDEWERQEIEKYA